MKYFILILFFPLFASAQSTTQVGGNYSYNGDSYFTKGRFFIPVRDTINNKPYVFGALTIRPQDTVGHPSIVTEYSWNGSKWVTLGGVPSTPTWQQTLNAPNGSILTGNNYITTNGYQFGVNSNTAAGNYSFLLDTSYIYIANGGYLDAVQTQPFSNSLNFSPDGLYLGYFTNNTPQGVQDRRLTMDSTGIYFYHNSAHPFLIDNNDNTHLATTYNVPPALSVLVKDTSSGIVYDARPYDVVINGGGATQSGLNDTAAALRANTNTTVSGYVSKSVRDTTTAVKDWFPNLIPTADNTTVTGMVIAPNLITGGHVGTTVNALSITSGNVVFPAILTVPQTVTTFLLNNSVITGTKIKSWQNNGITSISSVVGGTGYPNGSNTGQRLTSSTGVLTGVTVNVVSGSVISVAFANPGGTGFLVGDTVRWPTGGGTGFYFVVLNVQNGLYFQSAAGATKWQMWDNGDLVSGGAADTTGVTFNNPSGTTRFNNGQTNYINFQAQSGTIPTPSSGINLGANANNRLTWVNASGYQREFQFPYAGSVLARLPYLAAPILADSNQVATALANKYGPSDTAFTLSTKANVWKVRDSLLTASNTWQQTQLIASSIIGGNTPTGTALSNANALKIVGNSKTGLVGYQNLNDTGYASYDLYRSAVAGGGYALSHGYANHNATQFTDSVYWNITSAVNAATFQFNKVPKFTLSASKMTMHYFNTAGGLLYTNATGDVSQTAAGTSSTLLHGGTAPAYGAVNLATETSGTLPTASLPFTFTDSTNKPYLGTITWTGTTAPSGTANLTYNAIVIGNRVDLQINLSYSVAGTAITGATIPLPSWLPTPVAPSGFSSGPVAPVQFFTFTATGAYNQALVSGQLTIGGSNRITVFCSSQSLLQLIVRTSYFTN